MSDKSLSSSSAGTKRQPNRVLFIGFKIGHRASRLMKYLARAHWEPFLLTAVDQEGTRKQSFMPRFQPTFPADHWVHSGWVDWIDLLKRATRSVGIHPQRQPTHTSSGNAATGSGLVAPKQPPNRLRPPLIGGDRMPDAFLGWIPFAVRQGIWCMQAWEIDIIYASGMPPSSLVIGSLLSRLTGKPWVAEYRDPWSTSTLWGMNPRPPVVQALEERFERAVVGSASAILTVSQPWATELERLHRRSVLTLPHGYDEEVYAAQVPLTPQITLTYTGSLNQRRDPTPLFEALASLRQTNRLPATLWVRYYGAYPQTFLQAAHATGMADMTTYEGSLADEAVARVQQESTILVLLETVGPEAFGMFSLKLGEYLGARRPILAFGARGGAIDQVLQETGAGTLVTNADDAATVLATWFAHYALGKPDLGLSRKEAALACYTQRYHAQQLMNMFDHIQDGMAKPATRAAATEQKRRSSC